MKSKLSAKERRALERAGKEVIYLYCIAPRGTQDNFEVSGLENSSVYTIPYNNLLLIVSDVAAIEPSQTEENVEAHKKVALSALQKSSVLPVAFGMVFKNKKILLGTVRKVYPLLRKSLWGVSNKVELGLKVVLPENINLSELSDGKSREEFLQELEKDFLEKLGGIATHTKKGKLFSERLALNASFLVTKDSVESFSEEVGNVGKKYQKLKIQYSGPWPAYNFVDIKIMSKGGGGG